MKKLSLLILSLLAIQASATPDLTKEMDALGANKDLMKKARAIDPENRIRVVQNREVSRNYRFEVGLNASLNAGGDPYVSTSSYAGTVDFHFTPRFSVGGRFATYNNSLTSEGKAVFDDAQARRAAGDNNFRIPSVDYAKNSWVAVFNWYPIYGKMNLFDLGIAQFDLYALGGAGQIQLGSGTSQVLTAGGGVGMWLSQHVSSRLEARWQGYQDHVESGSRRINQTILGLTVGFLL